MGEKYIILKDIVYLMSVRNKGELIELEDSTMANDLTSKGLIRVATEDEVNASVDRINILPQYVLEHIEGVSLLKKYMRKWKAKKLKRGTRRLFFNSKIKDIPSLVEKNTEIDLVDIFDLKI